MRIGWTSFAVIGIGSMAIASPHVHFDLSPVLADNKIRVDGLTHASTVNPWTNQTTVGSYRYIEYNKYVFEYEFGEDPDLPTYADDPGVSRDAEEAVPQSAVYNPVTNTYNQIVSADTTGLRPTTNDRIRFQIMDDLKYWDGSTFVPVPDQESLTFLLSGHTRTVGTGTGVLTDFPLSWMGASDSLHLHASVYLNGGGGVNPDPTDGVYLLTGRFNSTISSVASSDLFYVVYGFNADEEDHEDAVAYAQSLVPEPTTLGLLGLSGWFLGRRRRS